MKPYLLFRPQDRQVPPLPQEADLVKDLNLPILYNVMAKNDDYIRRAVARLVPRTVTDPDLLRYRQEILQECLRYPNVIRRLYEICSEAALEASEYQDLTRPGYAQVVSAASRLQKNAGLVEVLLEKLQQLANVTHQNTEFTSEGLMGFCMRTNTALTTEFFAGTKEMMANCKNLSPQTGLTVSGRIGPGLKGSPYVLRAFTSGGMSLFTGRIRIPLKEYLLAAGAKEAEEACFVHANRIVSQLATHMVRFMESLRGELAFYLGGVNLHRWMTARGLAVCFPDLRPMEENALDFVGLYDLSIAVADDFSPIANDLDLNGKFLLFVTGANQGGKSTFLRSIGISLVLAHIGFAVPAKTMALSVKSGIFTHFARAEDENMDHGKFEEELDRMNNIVNLLEPYGCVLMNEAFATTTEHEGAAIGTGLLSGLYQYNTTVFYVTHLYELADFFYAKQLPGSEYLIAQRLEDGSRSFHIVKGAPRVTSYGDDLYNKIIGKDR